MLQDQIVVNTRYEKFIKTICDTEIIYSLENDKGFATSNSIHYINKNKRPLKIICFWSDKTRAKSCIKGSWKKYRITEIPLAEFLESWCVGMHKENVLAGIQFDHNMFGYEAKSNELVIDTITQLKSINKELKFRQFNNIEGLKNSFNIFKNQSTKPINSIFSNSFKLLTSFFKR